jgi:hypothetical protein
MPRIRSIKPTFARSRSVKRLNDKQKLVWICLWPVADDYGRLVDEPGQLVGDLWALSLTEPKLDAVLTQLHDAGRLVRYEVAGESYIQITNWSEHQKISNPTESRIPPAPLQIHSANVSESIGLERKGKDRKGGDASDDAEPPLFCTLHWINRSPGPCPQCGDARRAHEAWMRRQKPVAKATQSGIITPKTCKDGYPAGECPYCDEAVAS